LVKANAARYSSPDPDFGRIPTVYPSFDALYVDQAQRLWVERLIDAKKHRFEVYGPTGSLIAEGDFPVLPRGERPVIISEDRILCFVADEDDVVYLVSLRIVR